MVFKCIKEVTMLNIIKNLLKIKSLMTISVMAVFCILALRGSISDDLTASVITAVITYYFTKTKESE